MVTPFQENGAVDEAGVIRLLAWFRAAGCAGVVLAGTNGEGPSLGAVEKRDLARLAVSHAEGLQVVLGIATPSLDEAVWLGKQAGKLGVEAILVMPPAYFREATQAGIAGWFEKLISQVDVPTIVYNFPQRTGVRFEMETISRLAQNPGVVGFKDSSGEKPNLALYAEACSKKLYCGDETLLLDALSHGWTGTISGSSNVLASWFVPIVQGFQTNRESSKAKYQIVGECLAALRAAPQPYTNKEILRRLGVIDRADVRLPLAPVNGDALEKAASLAQALVK